MNVHPKAWQHFKVRPASSSAKPELTDPAFCVYDPVHEDYVYTNAWIDKLEKELADPLGFAKIVGRPPRPRVASV